MALDANIFAQYLRPAKSIADYDAEFQDQQRNALLLDQTRQGIAQREATMRADEQAAAAAAQERNALAQALQRIDPSTMDGQNTLMRAAPNEAMGYLKNYADVQGKFATAGKSTADAAATKLKTARQQFEYAIQGLQVIPDPQTAAKYIRDGVSKGVWSMQDAEGMVRTIPQNPAEFPAWRATQLRQILEAEKQLPKMGDADMGGSREYTATDPVTGRVTVQRSAPITQSANNKATVGASYANAAATRDIAAATRDAAKITARAQEETGLRKEFADLPEVKKYKNSIPAYRAIVEAAKTNNPQADINLVYGVAKLYDPDSVVREGEYATIANSQAIPEWLKGQAQRLAGGGKLTAETKKQIQEQAKIRIDSYKSEFDGAQRSYGGIASGRGLKPENVFPAVGEQISDAPQAGPVRVKSIEDARKLNPGTVFIDPNGVQRTR